MRLRAGVGPARPIGLAQQVRRTATHLRLEPHGERDGAVIACFGDPGLHGAREIAAGPAVGIAEAAMHVATTVGRTFSIFTTLSRTIGTAEHLALQHGFERHLHQALACDSPVLELEDPPSDARREVTEPCRRAVDAAPTRWCSAAPAWRTSARRCRARSAHP